MGCHGGKDCVPLLYIEYGDTALHDASQKTCTYLSEIT